MADTYSFDVWVQGSLPDEHDGSSGLQMADVRRGDPRVARQRPGRTIPGIFYDEKLERFAIARVVFGRERPGRSSAYVVDVEAVPPWDAMFFLEGLVGAKLGSDRGGMFMPGRIASSRERKQLFASLPPEIIEALRRKAATDQSFVANYTPEQRRTFVLEQEAVETAISSFSGEVRSVPILSAPPGQGSFLQMLTSESEPRRSLWDSPRFIEDEVIMADFGRFIDFDGDLGGDVRVTKIRSGGRELHIIHANRNPIEHTLGVDLVYYVPDFELIVGVQYKMLEEKAGGRWYAPDAHCVDQIGRMDSVLDILGDEAAASPDDYRLCSGPFYFKFVDRSGLSLVGKDLLDGLYVPLDLARLTLSADAPPRFGRDVGSRYLAPRLFAQLVRDGWIGTRRAGTETVRQVVKEVLDGGRSLLLAVERRTDADRAAIPRSRRRRVQASG